MAICTPVSSILRQVSFHDHQPNYFTMRTIRKPKILRPTKCMSTLVAVDHFTTRKNLNMVFNCKPFQMSARVIAATTTPNAHAERNIWATYFLNYTPEDDEAVQAQKAQEVNELKEEVRKELKEYTEQKPIPELLKFLDSIQRLGVGYHFEDEIEAALNQLYHETHDLDLCHAALLFRLLRQHGHYISCDIFKQFLDCKGNFKASIASDVEGMLSLYEASHVRVHGDKILDEALTFSINKLKLMTSGLDNQLAMKVAHALEYPLHKTIARLESRYYISQYEHDPFHNKILLKFAKLDFNLLQVLHKRELRDLMRWCYGLDVLTKVPCNIREVSVEIYFCAFGTMDESPRYALGRIIYFKLVWIGTVIDDLYDTLDSAELKLLTEALQRWDKGCVNQLPTSLKLIYTILLDIFEEVQQHLAKEGRPHIFHYIVESFKIIWLFHSQSSEWCHKEYVPSFEAYMTTSVQIIGLKFCTIVSYVGLGEVATQEVFEWALRFPKVIEALCKIGRLEDDIAEDDPMERVATHNPSAISSYMKQHEMIFKDQVYEDLRKIIEDAWKDINHAMLQTTIMPKPVLERILTQARYLHVLYRKGDGFTNSNRTPMKKNMMLLFKDPIPI